jgi:murein DD-endopeptidase MepM/ murein hydrolase activator NlpD
MERAFVPREIFFRSADRFHHFRVSPRLQQGVFAVVVIVAGWVLYASGAYVVHDIMLASKEREISQQNLAYFDLLSESNQYNTQFSNITRDLEDNQSYLLSLLEKSVKNRAELDVIQHRLKASEDERARVLVAREGLREKMERFAAQMSELGERKASLSAQVAQIRSLVDNSRADVTKVAAARERLVDHLAELEGELAAVTDSKRDLEASVESLHQELATSEDTRRKLVEEKSKLSTRLADVSRQFQDTGSRQAKLEDQIASLQGSLAQEIDRNQQKEQQREFLQRRVGGLEQRLVDLRDAGQTVMERLSERAKVSMEVIEKTVAMTGLDADAMIAAVDSETLGQGGPFIPVSNSAADFEPSLQLEASVSMLDQQLDRWTALREVIRTLPLTAPLDEYRISSGFGARIDPVNGRKGQHQGIDFGAPMRSPVYAPAPGKVVFAGWRGRYGRTIDIDHGNGIRTRYGHLKKILVTVGQMVGHREKIALLGSSGRSTGPHVHYEIRYNGRPLDPMKFIKAGEYVFKG